MNIEKLPSGSYRIRHTDNGITYRMTVKYKPTRTEAMALITEQIKQKPVSAIITFENACNAYIDAKYNVLSPTTRKEYLGTVSRLPEALKEMRLSQITPLYIQKVINDLSVNRSPKTVANYSAFIMAVLRSQEINIKQPKLPQKEKKSLYIPTEKDIQAILAEIRGTDYEIPFMLSCFGLRRSEVCALTVDDLHGCNLTINKAKVKDENKQWVIKTTKTTESTRTIIIPQELADKIREQGYIYKGSPHSYQKMIPRVLKKLGLPAFSLHKMRHFFASYLHAKGYSDKQIQEMGGWKTDNVMKEIYQHAMDMDEAKLRVAEDIYAICGVHVTIIDEPE